MGKSPLRIETVDDLQPLIAVADLLGFGLSVIDRDMRVIEHNKVAAEWFPEVATRNAHCFAAHWGRNSQCPDCFTLRVFQSGESIEGVRVAGRPGEPRQVYRVSAIPVQGPDGVTTHVVETLIRFRSVSLLPGSPSELESAMTRSPLTFGYLVVDTEDRVRSWSDGAAGLLGHRHQDALGRPLQTLVPDDHRTRIGEVLALAKVTGGVPRFETEMLDATGKAVPVVLSVSALANERGDLIGHLATVEDRREVHHLRSQLGLQARLLEKLLEKDGGALLSTDTEGRVLSISRGGEELLGIEASVVLGRPLGTVIGEPGAHRVCDLAKSAGSFQGERMIWETAAGERIEVDVSAARLELEEDGGRCLAILARNAAQARRLERQMIRSEKLAVTGSLAAGLAHEIGTPLNVISATAEYLLLDQPEEGGFRSELRAIVEETERIGGLVSELLDYARESSTVREPLAIAVVVERAVSLLRITVERGGSRLVTEVPEDLPRVSGNADELHQILINLLMNAAEAVGGGGEIHVTARSRPGEADAVVLEVHDDGPGIPVELRERVFDPFYTTRKDGTGLGLSICARIAQSHGGDLRVMESPLGGACFALQLPAVGKGPKA